MMTKRRRFSVEVKKKVAMDVLRGDHAIAARYGIYRD